MKKLVVGCGLLMLLVTVAGAVGLYYFVYRPAKALVSSVTQLGEVAELDRTIANTRAFAAPDDGVLTAAQVTGFVAIQESIKSRLGVRAAELEAKYKELGRGDSDTPRSLTDVVGAYRDVFGLIVEAKRAQVDALNAQRFSLDEYAWVKARVFEAAGVAVTGVDLRELAAKVQQGDLEALQQAETPDDTPGVGIPDANRTLVAPHTKALETWLPFAAFGL